VSVASTGSFRTAASRLHTSQAAVSRAVARLERQLGVTLLDRGPRGAVVTPAGHGALAHARRIGTQVSLLRADAAGGASTVLRLGAAATASGSYLAPFLASWIPRHPDVRVEVVEDGSAALADRLVAGDCDLAIVSGPVAPELEVVPIREVAVRAYYPAGHPLDVDEPVVGARALAEHPLVLNPPGYLAGRLFLRECEASAVFPQVRYRSTVGQTLAALAEAGLGVAVMADSVDLRGFDLRSRMLTTANGYALSFTLAAAWARTAPPWVRECGRELAAFSRRRATQAPGRTGQRPAHLAQRPAGGPPSEVAEP